MSLIQTQEQESLAKSLEDFIHQRSSFDTLRDLISKGEHYSVSVWESMSQELGLAALPIPEEFAGLGATQADLSYVFKALGAGLVPSPLFSSGVQAAGLLMALGAHDDTAADLAEIASGELVAAVAVAEDQDSSWIPATPRTTASTSHNQTTVSGTKTHVPQAAAAQIFYVVASAPEGRGVYAVRRDSPGVSIEAQNNIDPLSGLASVSFDDVAATRLGGDVEHALDQLIDRTNLAVCSWQVGAIGACLKMTSEYAVTRHAFGLPIGSYQAVKHPLAQVFTDLRKAEAQLRVAIDAFDRGQVDSRAITAARVLLSPLYVHAAKTTQLLHGGIGFTWEHNSHLYFKNAVCLNTAFGDRTFQLDRLARQLEI